MPTEPIPAQEPKGQVIKLRPHLSLRRPPPAESQPPVEDLSKYEQTGEADDYRHRMLTNLAAGAAALVLILIGTWIAITMAETRKNQDCVLSGRRNCAGIVTPPPQR